jgi:hypothetical protein
MLTLSYSQCIADPTYCDDGKKGGAALLRMLSLKPNEPVKLRRVFPHITLKEALWCLRAVRKSQKIEAREVLWDFVAECVAMFPEIAVPELTQYIENRRAGVRISPDVQLHLIGHFNEKLQEDGTFRIARVIVAEQIPSQVGINLVEEMMRQGTLHRPNRNIEQEMRDAFWELIDG